MKKLLLSLYLVCRMITGTVYDDIPEQEIAVIQEYNADAIDQLAKETNGDMIYIGYDDSGECVVDTSRFDQIAREMDGEMLYVGFDYGTHAASILEAAAWVEQHTQQLGYHYDNATYWDGQDMYCGTHHSYAVSCDRGVAFSLYMAGYTDMTPSELSLGVLDAYLQNHGALLIQSFDELQPGDIVFYDKNHNGTLEATDHTFIYAGGLCVYDWGCDERIQNPDAYRYCGMNREAFGWAYRLP